MPNIYIQATYTTLGLGYVQKCIHIYKTSLSQNIYKYFNITQFVAWPFSGLGGG